MVDEAQVRQPAPGLQHIGDFIEHRRHRGRRVLRIQRQHQDTAGTGETQCFESASDRRVAVTHGEIHQYIAAEAFLDLFLDRLCLQFRGGDQR